jgi:hypothetical protein
MYLTNEIVAFGSIGEVYLTALRDQTEDKSP